MNPENITPEASLSLVTDYDAILNATEDTPDPNQAAIEQAQVEPSEEETTEPVDEGSTEQALDSEEEKKEVKKEEEKAKPAKTSVVKAKTPDGKEVELDKNTKFIKTVEGEEREVSLKDALDHYAFEVNYTKKYQEASELKKSAEAEATQAKLAQEKATNAMKLVGAALNETVGALNNGNIDNFLQKFSEITQVPPAKIASQLRAYFIPQIQQYLEADEAGRKLLDAEEKAKYLGQEEKRLESTKQAQARLADYQRYAQAQMAAAGITQEDWLAAEKTLVDSYLGGVVPQFQTLQPHELQQYVEAVVLSAKANKQDMGIAEIIEQASPGLKDKNAEIWDEVKKTVAPFIGQLDNAEIIGLIKEVVGSDDDDLEEAEDKEELEDKSKSLKTKAPTAKPLDPESEDYNPLSVYE